MSDRQVEIIKREMLRTARGFAALVEESQMEYFRGGEPHLKYAYARNDQELTKVISDYDKANYFWVGFGRAMSSCGMTGLAILFAPKARMKEIMSRA